MGDYYETLESVDGWRRAYYEEEQGKWENVPDKNEDIEEDRYLYER